MKPKHLLLQAVWISHLLVPRRFRLQLPLYYLAISCIFILSSQEVMGSLTLFLFFNLLIGPLLVAYMYNRFVGVQTRAVIRGLGLSPIELLALVGLNSLHFVAPMVIVLLLFLASPEQTPLRAGLFMWLANYLLVFFTAIHLLINYSMLINRHLWLKRLRWGLILVINLILLNFLTRIFAQFESLPQPLQYLLLDRTLATTIEVSFFQDLGWLGFFTFGYIVSIKLTLVNYRRV